VADALAWQLGLLVPQPPLAGLYLLGIRAGRVEPRFAAVLLLAALPLTSLVVGGLALRRAGSTRWRWHAALIVVGVVEGLWAFLSTAAVGIAIGLRSG
jgi:hypothetical protein